MRFCAFVSMLFVTIADALWAQTPVPPLKAESFASPAASPAASPEEARLPFPIVFIRRHLPADFIYRGPDITVRRVPMGVRVIKRYGPDSVELIVDVPIEGDFTAEMGVVIHPPIRVDPNWRDRGGTPIPYYGFRAAKGEKEATFFMPGFTGPHQIKVTRQGDTVTGLADGQEDRKVDRLDDPGYLSILMNDASAVTIKSLRVTNAKGERTIDFDTSSEQSSPKQTDP